MKVSFELSASDIRYFRDRLKQVRKSESSRDEQLVIRGAAKLLTDAVAAKPPDFVVERILRLEQLIEMLRDREWRLEGRDRARILDALAYFVDPDDLIPDRVPGIGYLDDAIMIDAARGPAGAHAAAAPTRAVHPPLEPEIVALAFPALVARFGGGGSLRVSPPGGCPRSRCG
jgi:hypothetical protein